MLKRSRFFLSATLLAAVFVSALILSNPPTARACPVPPPDSLLSLYMRSDLIVVAEIAGETNGETIKDYEDYFSIEINRALKVSSVLKGKPPADIVFSRTEYHEKNPSENEESGDDEFYSPFGYRGYTELRKGERYLFFFVKDQETGKYDLTDHVSGAKKLNDYDLSVHQKRIRELQSIIKTQKNQLFALNQWLIRCVEEPSTRWDGVFILVSSFDDLEYADESDEAEPFRLDEDSLVNTVAIARNLTDSQKATLSNIAFGEIQQGSFNQLDDHYSLRNLVGNWDKPRLAIYAFNILQGIDKSDDENALAAMNYISDLVEDEALAGIVERYAAVKDADQSAEKTDEKPAEQPPAEELVRQTELSTTPEIASQSESTAPPVRTEAETIQLDRKPTPAELRGQFLQDFAERFQYLVAIGFQNPDDDDSAQTSVAPDK